MCLAFAGSADARGPSTIDLVQGLDDPAGESPELMAKAALVLASEPQEKVTGW